MIRVTNSPGGAIAHTPRPRPILQSVAFRRINSWRWAA
jgi:hypothetical protein